MDVLRGAPGGAEGVMAGWGFYEYALLAFSVLLSLLVSNAIAWWIERDRRRRIGDKTTTLARKSKVKTPVTILTGFLGSGKTTLVNRILTSDAHNLRIAVIENEAGALSIDDKLLSLDSDAKEKAAVGIYVMKNGCMCCTGDGAGPELERVLNHMLELQKDDQFDYVLIECSGLADPAPVMQTFFSHKTAQGRFVLDGVVTVVDAKNIWSHLDGSGWLAKTPEVQRQIAHATKIIINKVDTLEPGDNPRSLSALSARLREMNPGAS
ncbi:CobW/HypB/UreG, nucleotide-binding domain-containing protein, partial [Baffinella frigidus]